MSNETRIGDRAEGVPSTPDSTSAGPVAEPTGGDGAYDAPAAAAASEVGREAESPAREPTASPPRQAAIPPKRRGAPWGAMIVVLALAAIAAGAWVYRDQIEGMLASRAPAPTPPDPIATLRGEFGRLGQRVAELSGELGAVRDQVAALPAEPAASTLDEASINEQLARLEQASSQLQALTERISRLEQVATQTAALEAQVKAVAAQAERLQQGQGSMNAAVLAVGQLAAAAAQGAPYVRSLATVRSIAGGDPDVAEAVVAIEPFAASGAPTTAALAARFPAVADEIARAAPTTEGETWRDRVVDRIAGLVTIRAIGERAAGEGGLDAALEEAQRMLDGGDLAGATAIVAAIRGPAAVPAQGWLADARRRLTLDQGVAALQQVVVDRLASRG